MEQYRSINKPKKKLAPRTWRTRKDPFVAIWGEIQLRLELNPGLSAAEFLNELIDKYPNQYSKKYIRTLQRRISEWRKWQWKQKGLELVKNKPLEQSHQSEFMSLVLIGKGNIA